MALKLVVERGRSVIFEGNVGENQVCHVDLIHGLTSLSAVGDNGLRVLRGARPGLGPRYSGSVFLYNELTGGLWTGASANGATISLRGEGVLPEQVLEFLPEDGSQVSIRDEVGLDSRTPPSKSCLLRFTDTIRLIGLKP